jgi:hypothetical protein
MRLENKGWIFVNSAGKYQTYRHIARNELAEYESIINSGAVRSIIVRRLCGYEKTNHKLVEQGAAGS